MNRKYDLNFVIEFLTKHNLTLVSDNYVSVNKPLLIKCNHGHTFKKSLDKLMSRNAECPGCRPKLRKERNAKKLCLKYNFKYLEYNHKTNKINCVCSNGHTINKTSEAFRRGRESSCKECARLKHIKTRSHTLDYVKDFIKNQGEELISTEYINSNCMLQIKCSKQHIYDIRFGNYHNGHRCPNCFYKKETQCRDIIEKLTGKKFPKVRPTFLKFKKRNLELDGYSEELQIAFEYDGEQHFFPATNWGGQERLDRDQIRDRYKDQACKTNAVKLLRIPYSVKDKTLYITNWLIENNIEIVK